MIVGLDFEEYIATLDFANQTYKSTQHLYETDDALYLFFKNYEHWEYFTEVKKSYILEFSSEFGLANDPIEDFKRFFCHECVEVESVDFLDELGNVIEQPVPVEVLEPMPMRKGDVYLTSEEHGHSHTWHDGDSETSEENGHVHPINHELGEAERGNTDHTHTLLTIGKSFEIDAGQDIIDESKTYGEFISNTFKRMERNVLKAITPKTIDRSYKKKAFEDLIRDLFGIVGTKLFADKVRRFLREDLVAGMKAAEEETGMDIGFNDIYQQQLDVMKDQQIEGYMVGGSGKKWPGIKGVTRELQSDVIMVIQEGVEQNKSLAQIKEDITKRFDVFEESRAMTIARTETNRIVNEGKVIGYKSTGIPGGKVLMVRHDHRTSDVCERMGPIYENKAIPLDELFRDPLTGQTWITPPFLPNCRSTIFFRPD